MTLRTETIDSVFGGKAPSFYFSGNDQYNDAIGMDPDMPASDDESDTKSSGIIRWVNYDKFSGAEVTSSPIAIIPNPKNSDTYVVLSEGKVLEYDSDLAYTGRSWQCQESASDVAARGADYYNNYIFIRTPLDVSRLGPMDDEGSIAITNEWWTGAGLDPLTDADYPETLFGIGYLNHFGSLHVDNKLYFLDYSDGIGYVHFIKTTKGTAEGDTNDGSTWGALDLPLNYYPITVSPYGNDISVAASFTTDPTVLQGKAKLFFWNTVDDSFYRAVPLPHTMCSGLKYDNGTLYTISGDLGGGYQLSRYVGGDAVEALETVPDGYPPLQSAVDYVGNRIVWGANITDPMTASCLLAYGSKSDLFRGLHNIAFINQGTGA